MPPPKKVTRLLEAAGMPTSDVATAQQNPMNFDLLMPGRFIQAVREDEAGDLFFHYTTTVSVWDQQQQRNIPQPDPVTSLLTQVYQNHVNGTSNGRRNQGGMPPSIHVRCYLNLLEFQKDEKDPTKDALDGSGNRIPIKWRPICMTQVPFTQRHIVEQHEANYQTWMTKVAAEAGESADAPQDPSEAEPPEVPADK